MFKQFLTSNSRSLLFIGSILLIWVIAMFFQKDTTESLLKHPKKGQIYILHSDNIYAPMLIDSVADNTIYMFNYLYDFADAIPKRKQILMTEFDTQFYAIYEQDALYNLYEEGKLLKIYE